MTSDYLVFNNSERKHKEKQVLAIITTMVQRFRRGLGPTRRQSSIFQLTVFRSVASCDDDV